MSRHRITPAMKARVTEMVAQLEAPCCHTLQSLTVSLCPNRELYVELRGPGGLESFLLDEVKLTPGEWNVVATALVNLVRKAREDAFESAFLQATDPELWRAS